MSDIRWIKVAVDMFEDSKIETILDMPDGDMIFLVWMRLYIKAKRLRDRDRVYVSEGVNFTPKFLSWSLGYTEQQINRALDVLTTLEMVEMVGEEMKIVAPWLTNTQIRNSQEYREWRTSVFERDDYTCIDCGATKTYIQAHHVKPFATYKGLRFDVNNGITLCVECHKKRHRREDGEDG